jgi:hypothetical protein
MMIMRFIINAMLVALFSFLAAGCQQESPVSQKIQNQRTIEYQQYSYKGYESDPYRFTR